MAKKKLGILRRNLLKLKLVMPMGVQLSDRETTALIGVMEEDAGVLTKNQKQLEDAERSLSSALFKLPTRLTEVKKARTDAARYFKQTKDPIKRRDWARRLIVAEKARESIADSQKRMEATVERVKGLVADATLEKQALDIRIEEAKAYQKMGAGLHLVGESLIDARTRAKHTKLEYTNLEIGIEAIEKTVHANTDESIISEAQRILDGERK